MCDTRNRSLSEDEWNCWQLKQKHVSWTPQQNYHRPFVAMMQNSTQKQKVEPSWNGTSAFPEILGKWSGTIMYQDGSHWGYDHDTYRFLEEDGTAWISCGQGDCVTDTRPSPSSKATKKWWAYLYDANKTPAVKDLTTRLSPSSLRPASFRYDTTSGHIPTMFATTSTRPGMERSFVMTALRNAGREAIQSRDSALFNGFIMNSVMDIGSRLQTRMQQFAGGNASIAADQMWGTQRASHGTHFPDSLKQPLPEHEDPPAETQKMYRDRQHQEFWPGS